MKGHGQLWDTAEVAMTRSGDITEGQGAGESQVEDDAGLWNEWLRRSCCLQWHRELENPGAVWRKCQAPVRAWPIWIVWEIYMPMLSRQCYTCIWTVRGSLAVSYTGVWAWERMIAQGRVWSEERRVLPSELWGPSVFERQRKEESARVTDTEQPNV